MKLNEHLEVEIDASTPTTLAAWAPDTSGNPASITLRVNGLHDDGHTSFTPEQAVTFAGKILELVNLCRKAG